MSRRIAVLIGTRPEAIKMAPVIAALKADSSFEPYVINSGQHREMIEQAVRLFDIDVDANLAAMEPSQTLATLTSRLVDRIDRALAAANPDMVLVQGDTTSVLCAAMASFYRKIPIGHVEAGLRTGDIYAPFPEEANRRLISPLTSLHFAPTETARNSLLAEGVSEQNVFVTGNTVIDALFAELRRQQNTAVQTQINLDVSQLIGNDWQKRALVLVTGHRRENFGKGFESICAALAELSRLRQDILIVYPVHLNPQVSEVVYSSLTGHANIRLIPPQPYSQFLALLQACKLVLTDSGGIQEEAPSLGKPVLVMRDSTERPEGVEAGTARLVGSQADRIVTETLQLLSDDSAYAFMARVANPYGDGRAAERIVDAIRKRI
jgi:UDP-N-acetylglucosamine 2-epimerase (non-hydrolysing)